MNLHGYGVLLFKSSWFLVKFRLRYVLSSLMDTAYRSFSSFITIDKGMSSLVLTFFSLPVGAEFFLEAEAFLFPLAGAERFVGPHKGSTPASFSSGGRGVLPTEDDSSAESSAFKSVRADAVLKYVTSSLDKVWIRQKSHENRQKTGKHGHEERKSTKEARKSSQIKKGAKNSFTVHCLPQFTKGSKREGFYQSKGGKDNSSGLIQDGRVKLVISKALIGSLKQEGHVEEGKHNRKLGFALESLTMKAQELHNGLPRWQSV
ncbi:hypothetical protein Tco_0058532 [Tanacetum coccineum]